MSSRRKTLVSIGILSVIISAAGNLLSPIEIQFIHTLTDSSFIAGAVFGVSSIAFAVAALSMGRLSDRIGRTPLMIPAVASGIAYALLAASTHSVFMYMGIKASWAFSAAATGPLIIALFQDVLHDMPKQSTYIGYLYGAQALAGAATQYLGGVLADRYGITAPYYVMALFFVVATIWAVAFTRAFATASSPAREGAAAGAPSRSIFHGFTYIRNKPELVFYWIHNTATGLNWGIKPFVWPLIIFALAGSNAITGSIFATMGVVAFFLLFFAGSLADRYGAFHVISGAFVCMIVGGSALVLGKDISVFWVGAALFAAGEALWGPAQGALLTQHVDSHIRGEILGLDALVDTTLNSLSPFIAGALLVIWAPQAVLGTYIGILAVALVVGHVYYRTSIQKKQLRTASPSARI